MAIAWGIVLIVSSVLCWGGQVLSWLKPDLALRLALMEAEDTVEPVFWADARAEARWDSFTLWTMVAAGVLLVADHDSWAYFGLVGGGIQRHPAPHRVAAQGGALDAQAISKGSVVTCSVCERVPHLW